MDILSESVCIIIPTYNEQDCIKAVLEKWHLLLSKNSINFTLRVVNDGSTDNTASILDTYQQKTRECSYITQKNQGHGKSLLNGYRWACENNFSWVFQVDSDDEFEVGDFLKLWNLRSSSNFILGCRVHREGPGIRKLISKVLRGIINT